MWILFGKERHSNTMMAYKPIFADDDHSLFFKASINYIMYNIRSIDDEDKYSSPCYYSKYWNKIHNTVLVMMGSQYTFNDFIDLGEFNYVIEKTNKGEISTMFETEKIHDASCIMETYIPHPDVGDDYHKGFMYREFSMLEINELRNLVAEKKYENFIPDDEHLNSLSEVELHKAYITYSNYLTHLHTSIKSPNSCMPTWGRKLHGDNTAKISYEDFLDYDKPLGDKSKNSLRQYHLGVQQTMHLMWRLAFSDQLAKDLNLELLPDPPDCELIDTECQNVPRQRYNSI